MEADPAADFIAREQNALQALEDDTMLNNGESDFKGLNGEGNDAEGKGGDIEDDHSESNILNGPMKGIKSLNINNFSTSPVPPAFVKEEPEKIQKWRDEQKRLLEEKDEEEAKRKQEMLDQAKKELEEWYNRYAEQLEKSKLNNRNAEKDWIAERDAETPGQEWEKIAKMCDFNPKSARNNRDTSRMRSILLQLKQCPPSGISSRKSSS